MKIAKISSRKILDSRNAWTIETTMTTKEGVVSLSSVPSGTSTGSSEAKTVPAEQAVSFVEEMFLDIKGKDFKTLLDFDNHLLALDGTPDKSRFGANSILSLSIAFARAHALTKKIPLYKYLNEIAYLSGNYSIPKVMTLILEGGKHSSGKMDIQEFSIVCDSISDAVSLYGKAKIRLEEARLSTDVGLEGAFSPDSFDNKDALVFLSQLLSISPISHIPPAQNASRIEAGKLISLDIAQANRKRLDLNYPQLLTDYPILSLEDPLGEEDWEGWTKLNAQIGNKALIIGDDLTTTNPARIQRAIDEKCIGGVIIKPNQIGTVSETLTAVSVAKSAGIKVVVSHRSGETNDDLIADLAVGVEADFVKFGAPARGERIAKYNRLLEIQGDLFLSLV